MEEILGRAELDDLAEVQDADLVVREDRAEAVGDGEERLGGEGLADRSLDRGIGLREKIASQQTRWAKDAARRQTDLHVDRGCFELRDGHQRWPVRGQT